MPTQTQRVLAALKSAGRTGITQRDFLGQTVAKVNLIDLGG